VSDSAQLAIQIEGLVVRYPGVHALRGVDLTIEEGSFLLIGGRSGGGKSTLAHALLGLLTTDSEPPAAVQGRVTVGGLVPGHATTASIATRVGLVFQNPATQLFNGTVEEEVAFGPRNLDLEPSEIARRVEYALKAVGCEELRARSIRHLSGGEQQRVAIAASLAMRPSILVLDEPTANLDIQGTDAVVRTLAGLQGDYGITVVVIEHRLKPFANAADRLVWLQDGRVVEDGPPNQVLSRVQAPPLTPFPQSTGEESLVTLERVTAGYNGHPVLRECSLTLRRGEIAAVVGPNGAGKSTLARALAGLLRPRDGRVVWHRGRGSAGRVGFLQQNPLHQLVCPTVGEEVSFAPLNLRRGSGGPERLLEQAGLSGLSGRPTQALSVGEQQRTALAATLSGEPRLLILDEPTLGQDQHHLRDLMALVRSLNEQGQAVLLITHDRDLVARCAGRVWEMRDGHVKEIAKPDRSERALVSQEQSSHSEASAGL